MNTMTIYGLPGAAIVIPTVVMAALFDLAYRRIPNRLTASLLWLWGAVTIWFVTQHGMTASLSNELTFGVCCSMSVLLVGFFLFCIHAVGAGDVKLAAVLCLWLGKESIAFLLVTALAGGVLVLQLPLLRRMEMTIAVYAPRLPVLNRMSPAGPQTKSLNGFPYAPALAAGTLFTILRSWS